MIGAKYLISGQDDLHDDELGFTGPEETDIEYNLAGNERYHEPHEFEDLTEED